MKTTKKKILTVIFVILSSLTLSLEGYAQTPSELFAKGLEMANQAITDDNMNSFVEGLKIMEKAQKKDKKRGDWCYEIGVKYYDYVSFGGHIFTWDREKGLKWFKEGAKLGDLKSALVLYKKYKPESKPYSILSPKSEWNRYFKERDKCMVYAGIALKAEIPLDFKDYLKLADAASFANNTDLANQYAAKAAENKEWGALDYLIKDEKALEYLTSPEVMFEAAGKMWKRDLNEYGHNDKMNGFIWFEKSAKAGYPLAQNQMGYIYLRGWTVRPDTLKAVSWYKLAAKNKIPEAISALGRLYINGKGIERDVDKGFKLLNESADSGHINSKLYLGHCYLYGLGTSKDIQQARYLFQSYFDSFNHAPDLRLIYVDNHIIDLDYLLGLTYYYENSPQCVPLFEASLKNKSYVNLQRSDLLHKLASCYQSGLCGTPIDKAKSDSLLLAAAKFNSSEITEHNIELF